MRADSRGNRFDMLSFRPAERWTLSAALLLLVSQILLPSGPARAAVGPDVVLQPTPLVLKDGRIANVSIHVLPFDSGNGELPQDVASRLAELSAALATDCFLTAQVIGHVSSREVAENETLAAHRLARARADAVQAALIGSGLPAKAIASVWDWQFLVREPRATLWMFRLVEGEDCEGLPLDGAALVADNQVPAEPAARTSTAAAQPDREEARAPQAAAPVAASPAPRAEAAAPASDLAGMVGSAVAAETAPQAETAPEMAAATPARAGTSGATDMPAAGKAASPRPAATQPAEQPESRAVTAGPAPDAVPTLTRPLPALSPAPADPTAPAGKSTVAALEPRSGTAPAAPRAAAAATAPRSAAAAPQHAEREGRVEWGQDNVVITFATNSSYFPPGTTRRLRSLLGSMAEDRAYRVQLAVGVSGSDTVVGAKSPEEARQYNRWLAERRLDRVREWLDENAAGRQIEIEPAFQPDDNSRRVVVRVAPVG
jgi:hypothetical protein